MPELPEVETTVRGLARVLEGRTMTRIETRRAGLRRPFPVDLAQALTGARVTGLSRRAKYGLIHTDRERTLVFHLGMSGRWRIDPGEIGKHDHLVLETSEGQALALNDARRFGFMLLIPTMELQAHALFAEIGVEPLGDELTAAHLARLAHGRKTDLKAFLLDQRNIAGLGNIYVAEALHRARLNPKRPASVLAMRNGAPSEHAKRLAPEIKAVLEAALQAGGSTLKDYRKADGSRGAFQDRFAVYGRDGEPCEHAGCQGTIKRIVQAGRSTFYCPTCQR